jgi:hypothetical protein
VSYEYRIALVDPDARSESGVMLSATAASVNDRRQRRSVDAQKEIPRETANSLKTDQQTELLVEELFVRFHELSQGTI